MSTFALAHDDYVKNGNFAGVLGSSSPSPVVGSFSDLQDLRLSKVAGWNDLGTQVFYVTFAATLPLQIVAILDLRYNSSLLCQIHYIDTANNLQVIRAESDVIEYPTSDFVRHQFGILGAPVQAKGIRIILGDSTPSIPLTIGRIWAGPLWTPTDGIQNDWESSVIDPGEMGLSRGGQGYPRLRQRRRRVDMRLSHVPYASAFGNAANDILDLQQIGYRVGTTSPVIAFPRTRDAAGAIDIHAIHRLGVYGHLTEPLSIRHVQSDRFDTSFRVDELL